MFRLIKFLGKAIGNERGCFGGGSKYEAPPPAPAPAPVPSPVPSATESSVTAQDRRSKIANMRYGLMSTIKTSPQGVTGQGADLTNPATNAGKKTLGS